MNGDTVNKFQRWLLREINERNLSMREASLKAGLDHGAISRFLDKTQPSLESCRKLAVFFDVPNGLVLFLAGHLEAPPGMDDWLEQIKLLAEGWSEEQRGSLIDWMRLENRRRRS